MFESFKKFNYLCDEHFTTFLLTSLFKLLIGLGENGFLFFIKDAEARIFICSKIPAYSEIHEKKLHF